MPPPNPRLAATAARLHRGTPWEPVGARPLRFDAAHPQGMVRIGRHWWISTVDVATTSGTVLVVDADGGTLVERDPVGAGVRFHPGGLDFDGEALWVASAEYRPRSSAVVERLVPGEAPEVAFRADDHVGAVVRLGPSGDLVGWTWGSRRFLRWTVEGRLVASARNPGHYVDLQDGQWLGGDDDLVLCGGVGPGPLGGLGLLRGGDLSVAREVPFPHRSPATGRAATQNPLFAEVVGGDMVVHLLPDDGTGAAVLSYATPLV
ncbi:MAG TPA: DUF6454 family protein [Acidimicrobiales bacterium]|nr:DUF6454 family protein [Acidimicrobiales bacterium]